MFWKHTKVVAPKLKKSQKEREMSSTEKGEWVKIEKSGLCSKYVNISQCGWAEEIRAHKEKHDPHGEEHRDQTTIKGVTNVT